MTKICVDYVRVNVLKKWDTRERKRDRERGGGRYFIMIQ
jgi:hypothetical protein